MNSNGLIISQMHIAGGLCLKNCNNRAQHQECSIKQFIYRCPTRIQLFTDHMFTQTQNVSMLDQ